MRRCKICVLPEETQGIIFNNDGICNVCEAFQCKTVLGEDVLRSEIKRHFGDSHVQDLRCIVPVSGGRDSSYVLYYAKKILGLEPIAVQFDNCFHTEQARKNLENATKILDIKYYKNGPRQGIMNGLVREGINLAYSYRNAGLMSDLICHGCGWFHKNYVYEIAQEEAIPVVIWGDAEEESTRIMKWQQEGYSIYQKLCSRSLLNRIKYKIIVALLERQFNSKLDRPRGDIHLFKYIEWDRKLILDTIRKELNWEKPENSVSTWRIDCRLTPLTSHLVKKAYGANKMEVGFSNFIRAGKMARDEAIQQLEQIKSKSHVEIMYILEELHIDKEIIDWVIAK